MAKVYPRASEECEIVRCERVVDVIQGFRRLSKQTISIAQEADRCRNWVTYREEEIRNVMSDIHCETDVGEMKPVAQGNQSQGNNMVSHKLLEILPRLFQHQEENNGLLRPVAGLEEVIGLEQAVVLSVRVPFKHGRRIEVPDIRPAHHVQTKRSEDSEVHRSIYLLHEPGCFPLGRDPTVHGERTNHPLHNDLARKGEHNGVKRDESNVLWTLPIHDRTGRGFRGLRV